MILSYLYYGFYKVLLALPATHHAAGWIATLLFYSLFDHPHIFQTFSRTHGDPIERERRKFLYSYGLVFLIVLGFGICWLNLESPFEAFLNVYGIWHILRQNVGFLKLYRKREARYLAIDAVFDFGLLYGGVILLLAFRICDRWHRPLGWLPIVPLPADFFLNAFWVLSIIYAIRQFVLLLQKRLHLPKLIFLFAIVSTYYFSYVTSDPPLGILVAIETIYHDVQYQGWITHFQKRRFGAHSWRKWLLGSLLYGLLFALIALLSFLSSVQEWMLMPFYMLVFFHYFIDARIWRFSKSWELRSVYG